MKTIQFDIPTGMLAAVLDGRKTQTVRSLSNQGTYAVGEVLAVVEPYLYWWSFDTKSIFKPYLIEEFVKNFNPSLLEILKEGDPALFPADLARNFIKITGIMVKKPCEFTDAELAKEGIQIGTFEFNRIFYYSYLENAWVNDSKISSPSDSFKSLLCAIYGVERGTELFESEMLVLTFVLCDRDGKEIKA